MGVSGTVEYSLLAGLMIVLSGGVLYFVKRRKAISN
ncbi:QVPTGV class sortase B protein-sorting domain-containing protein [Neobacillus niacini]